MNEIDHEYTSNIICPYCGAEDGDSWEVLPEETELGKIKCYECDRTYSAERIFTVEYSTYKLDWLVEWIQYNKSKIHYRDLIQKYGGDDYKTK